MNNKIVYLWVEDYNEVHIDSQINFGSEYIFDLQKEKDLLILSYDINKSYIPDFFQTNNINNGIVNVSAFIGENGSGKSLLCSLLRKIVSGEIRQTDFLLIYQFENKGIVNHHIYNETEYTLELSKNYTVKKEIINKRKPYVHNDMHYGGGWSGLKGVESIFYSPINDLSNDSIIHNKPNDIDISTNHLNYIDIENEEYSRGALKPYHFHTIPRAANFKRQLRAIYELTSLSLPSGVEVKQDSIIIRLIELNINFSKMERSDFDNIPFQFIELLSELDKIYHKERSTLLDSLRSYERYGKEYNTINQDIFLLEFFRGAIRFFIYNLNQDNFHINHDQIKLELNGLGYEDAVREFLSKQDFIESKTLTILFDNVKSAKEKIHFVEYPNGNGEVVVQLPITTTQTLFINNEIAIENFRERGVSGHNDFIVQFLEFDVGINLSSGEKAYIDLYSRLYYAKKLLKEKTKKKNSDNETTKLIVLTIDEGELGFHPQWQKEYLFNLLKIVPSIFQEVSEKKVVNKQTSIADVKPHNLQLILTSHSPFLLSDLPIKNVNFIKRDNDTGKAEIKYGEEVGMTETFGANIHELFSESFFIENGLIGKFAQKKIQDIIQMINERHQINKVERTKLKLMINLIGEPYLRGKILEMYYNQFEKEARIEELERELKNLTDKSDD